MKYIKYFESSDETDKFFWKILLKDENFKRSVEIISLDNTVNFDEFSDNRFFNSDEYIYMSRVKIGDNTELGWMAFSPHGYNYYIEHGYKYMGEIGDDMISQYKYNL
jgi:hypothetical protein